MTRENVSHEERRKEKRSRLEEICGKIDQMSPIEKARMYGAFERQEEEIQRLKPIEKALENSLHVEEFFEMENGILIAKTHESIEKKRVFAYHVFLNGENMRKMYYSFEEALLAAMLIKGGSDATWKEVKALCRFFAIPTQETPLLVRPEKD